MTEAYFVDTNLLVYFRDSSEAEKQVKAAAWVAFLWERRLGRLSAQVLNEYYTIVTRKLKPGLSRETARSDIRDLLSWRPLALDEQVVQKAWSLEDQFSISWWDALIASAAQLTGCAVLLSEDLQDGQDLGGLLVVDPFQHPPPNQS
ncbi:MAG: PIN domain-containing protein [Acidobacteriota bacterium]